MSVIVRRILRLLHGSKGQSGDHCFFLTSFYLIKQLLHFFRTDLLPLRDVHRITEILNKCDQFLHFFFIRCFMDSVYKRYFLPEILFCHRLIGKKHEIFNDLCGYISVIRLDFQRCTVFIQHHLGFREVEINCPSFVPSVPKDLREFFHHLKHRKQGLVAPAFFLVMFLQDLLHTGITHPLIHIDHRLCNLMVDYVSFCVHRHDTAECQPVFAGI